ncbi:MAG TPA: hypothetical protein VGH65_00825 [Verrucomicrobiaceae bacterium]|jgi:hypothetical protein
MKSFGIRLGTLLALGALSPVLRADDPPWHWQSRRIPDLGFDLDAAKVIRVTSLDSKGPGTLRAALLADGPRIVVFEVAGVIDLAMKSIKIEDGQLVIAGQTAPSPGITIVRGEMHFAGSQTLVQHIRTRPGDAGRPKRSGWEPDGMSTTGAPQDVWFDHCSCTWSVDENLTAQTYQSPTGDPARRIHLRDCIIAEGLNDATHHKGPHSKGTLIDNGTQEVAIVHCLYASNVERNPVIHPGCSAVVVNCVIANPGERAIHTSSSSPGKNADKPNARVSIVGNAVLLGRGTKKAAAIFEGAADGYFKDNEGWNWLGEPLSLLRVPFETLEEPPLWPEGLVATSPLGALWHVARFAGARPAERDAIDQRIVSQALTGTARIINSQDEVGGYPKLEPVTRILEAPEKSRREWLEKLAREVEIGAEP